MDKESRSQINSQMSPMQILQMGFNPQQLQVLMHQYQQQQQQQQQLAFQSVNTQWVKMLKHVSIHTILQLKLFYGLFCTNI